MTEHTLERLLGAALLARQATICTAESCTGGLVASRITDVPGSSAYMLGGIVAYANMIKHTLLHITEQMLADYGAVSPETAAAMATSARAVFGADFAISVTGIAGPGGGTPSKPVGLTYIGLSGANGLLEVRRFVWAGDRDANKKSSAEAALQLALDFVN